MEKALEAGQVNTSTADKPADDKNRRQLKNFVVKPRYQLKFVTWFITGGFVTMVTTVALMNYRLQQIDHLLNSDAAMSVAGHIPVYDALTDITSIALAGFVLFVIYACYLAILINHRVGGPMIALIAHIDEIRNGNYEYQRKLRKKDELKPVHEALVDLSRTLKQKSEAQNKN